MEIGTGCLIGSMIDSSTHKVLRTKVKTVSFWFKKPFENRYIKIKVCLGSKRSGAWSLDWNTPTDWHLEPNDPLWMHTPLGIKPVPSKEYVVYVPWWPVKREVVG